MFFKKVKKISLALYFLKETFNKTKMEMNSENESQLKTIREPSLLLSLEESLAEKAKKYPCLFDKSQNMYREGDFVKNAWEVVASELHFIEDGMQSITQFIS